VTLLCPRCGQGLLRYHCEDVELVRCWGGHGVWIDNALSQRLASGDFPNAVLRELAALEAHAPPPGSAQPVGGCPECQSPLLYVHAQVANVGLDVCKGHGTWLDTGELARVARGALSPEPLPESEKPRQVVSRPLPTEQETRENTRRLESLVGTPDENTYVKGLRVMPGAILTALLEGAREMGTHAKDKDDYGYANGSGDGLFTLLFDYVVSLTRNDD
jgi:Zn-finger nucleic acid-binding protein